jgi:hypothetical protein
MPKYRIEVHACPRQYGWSLYRVNEDGSEELWNDGKCGLDSREEAVQDAREARRDAKQDDKAEGV